MELQRTRGLVGHGCADPAAAAAELLTRLRRGNVVVRAGTSECLVAQRGSAVAHVPGVPVMIVDTTGAGDAHLGAFIAGLATGRDAEAAARRGNVVAALTVTRRGPATSPTQRKPTGLLPSDTTAT